MSQPWLPVDEPQAPNFTEPSAVDINAWAELFATTIAHMAAQLTMTQLRLRALATVVSAQGQVDPQAVQQQLGLIAELSAGQYLRENLGEQLADAIELDSLEREIIAYLRGESSGPL